MSDIIRTLQPHAILITGDLVNSPWWWRFRNIYKKLCKLKKETLELNGFGDHLFVIPGNHDTRIYGIFPVTWLTYIIIGFIIACIFGWFVSPFPRTFSILIAIGAVVLLLRWLFVRKFVAYFGGWIPAFPKTLEKLGIALYPFDSATYASTAACGKIRLRDFVRAARNEETSSDAALYRIAMIHHHVLPIPYDAQNETMMVLKNAGAFLSEATRRRIRLVLCGHKHHDHFSRVVIDADGDEARELAVLSTGTPTAGKRPGRHGYNFSVIEINRHTSARITRYRARGGTFEPSPHFWVESVDTTGRVLLVENVRVRKCRCDTLALTVDISPDGDVRRTNFIRGFAYLGEDYIEAIPGRIGAYVGSGLLERLRVGGEPNANGIVPRLLPLDTDEPRRKEGRIGLSNSITRGHDPLHYSWSYDCTNCYAMSEEQFCRMHPGHLGPSLEWTELNLSHIPVSEATLLIKLPAGFRINGAPALSVTDQHGHQENRLQEAYRAHLAFNAYTNIIFLRLQYPPLGLRYRVSWRLLNQPPPSGSIVQSLQGRAKEAALLLLRLANNPGNNELVHLLDAIEQIARRHFSLEPSGLDPLLLSIMVFDESASHLRVAAANFAQADPRWNLTVGYGDGIAGRAYKMNRISLFIRSRAEANGTPLYYVTQAGVAPEQAILSLPLAPSQNPEALFGILSISSNRPGSRLVDLTEDAVTIAFQGAVSDACMTALEELYAGRPSGS